MRFHGVWGAGATSGNPEAAARRRESAAPPRRPRGRRARALEGAGPKAPATPAAAVLMLPGVDAPRGFVLPGMCAPRAFMLPGGGRAQGGDARRPSPWKRRDPRQPPRESPRGDETQKRRRARGPRCGRDRTTRRDALAERAGRREARGAGTRGGGGCGRDPRSRCAAGLRNPMRWPKTSGTRGRCPDDAGRRRPGSGRGRAGGGPAGPGRGAAENAPRCTATEARSAA